MGRTVKVYRDKFIGKTMERPGWDKLYQSIVAGNVAQVVIWRLDRLGRTASGLTKLFDELVRRKVGLLSIRDGFDLTTPAGRLTANMLASVAQFETEVRAERQAIGIAKARAKGKTRGGSKKGRRITVTDDQVKAIHRMHRDGESKSAMARATGLSRPTVYRLLNEATEAGNSN